MIGLKASTGNGLKALIGGGQKGDEGFAGFDEQGPPVNESVPSGNESDYQRILSGVLRKAIKKLEDDMAFQDSRCRQALS